MINDVVALAIDTNPIKNGTEIVTTTFTGKYSKVDRYVLNTPTAETIQNKYDNRFDKITYYTIGTGLFVGG